MNNLIISTNSTPSWEKFDMLLNRATLNMRKAIEDQDPCIKNLNSTSFETVVKNFVAEAAEDTEFRNTIELVSGHVFPDIIVHKFYGIEVKSVISSKWTSTGNSIFETTRPDDVQRIFMFFGQLTDPMRIMYKPYQDCLSDIKVTHSPRYEIDMELPAGQTIFDKMKIPYDEFRTLQDPVKTYVSYLKKVKPHAKAWWMSETESVAPIIQLYTDIPTKQQNNLLAEMMLLFPEVFGTNSKIKYRNAALWLVSKYGIVHPNMRDPFTAGGKESIHTASRVFNNLPKVFYTLYKHLNDILYIAETYSISVLSESWHDVQITETSPRNYVKQRWFSKVIKTVQDATYDNKKQILDFINTIRTEKLGIQYLHNEKETELTVASNEP